MKNKYIIALVTIFMLSTFSGCKKYFDLNTNPNQVTDPPLKGLLSTVTNKTGLNSYRVASITNYFVQYLANPSAGAATDIYDQVDYTGTWDNIYFAMADINEMKKKAESTGATQYTGVADILMAYHLSLITDVFGQGPYSQAFQNGNFTPVYDSEESLYKAIGSLLDEGIAALDLPNSTFELSASDDLIYGGKVDKWVKLGYTLKARWLNKISKKSSYNAAAILAAVDKGFTSNEDNAKMAVFTSKNPWNQVAFDNAGLLLGGWLSAQLVDAMNGKTFGVVDPRISSYTDKTINNIYIGTPNGAGNVGPAANTIKDECYISLTGQLSSPSSPLIIASYSEMKFIEAEAALKSGATQRAYDAYKIGINADMDFLNVAVGDKNTYLTSATVIQTSAALTLDKIFQEKYVATYLSPEAWNDARRHDYKYKDFTLPANALLQNFIRKVAYPDGEKSKNGANVPAATALSEPLWWDKP
ncbi:hypothetical protein ACVWYG_000882 [Pedobacter sp. UYEF25]